MHSPVAAAASGSFPPAAATAAAAAAISHHQQVQQHIAVTTASSPLQPQHDANSFSPHQPPVPPLPQYTGLGQQHLQQQQQQQQQQQEPPAPGAYPYHSGPPPGPPPQRGLGSFRRGVGGGRGRGVHHHFASPGSWDPARLYNSMNQYNSNPVGALQERFQARGIMPTYRMVQAEGASHCPTFSYQVFVLEFISMGSGSSKKQAKHNAARAMLDKLDGRMPAQDGLAPLPAVTSVTNAAGGMVGNAAPSVDGAGDGGADANDFNTSSSAVADGTGDSGTPNENGAVANSTLSSDGASASVSVAEASGNTIGQLQELCVRRGHPMPMYDLSAVDGQPHQRSFGMKVRVGALEAKGDGTSKKDAKRDAAARMIGMLNALKDSGGVAETREDGSTEGVGVAEDSAAENGTSAAEDGDDGNKAAELSKKLEELKIETLTPKHSAQIQKFYRELSDSTSSSGGGGRHLRALHATPLKRTSPAGERDFVRMLGELAKEQKFEVTYVEMEEEEVEEDGCKECLVQLSTLPVAVCTGRGADKAAAEQDAARSALVYLKTMTKKTVTAAAASSTASQNSNSSAAAAATNGDGGGGPRK